jgi:hypothetical protein
VCVAEDLQLILSSPLLSSPLLIITNQHAPLTPLNTTPLQRLQQLRPVQQTLPCLAIPHPAPNPLMALGPHVLLLVHQAVKELVRRPRGALPILFNLRLAALLFDGPEVALDRDVDPGFLPGFARGGFDFAFVGFPAAFGQDPAFAGRGLDEEDLGAVGGEGDDAGYEALALGAVSRGWGC